MASSLMSGLSKEAIEIIGQLLKVRQQSTSSTASPTMDRPKLVDDYSSDDEEESLTKHLYCCSKHSQSVCLDERCKGKEICHYACQGCPHIPENIQKKEQLKKEKERAKTERALIFKTKKIEKYGKMLADAEAYKAKWGL
jgi:hypothetical protein